MPPGVSVCPRSRALAACERLVLLCGDACPAERRDLAVIYLHIGLFRGEQPSTRLFTRRRAALDGAQMRR